MVIDIFLSQSIEQGTLVNQFLARDDFRLPSIFYYKM